MYGVASTGSKLTYQTSLLGVPMGWPLLAVPMGWRGWEQTLLLNGAGHVVWGLPGAGRPTAAAGPQSLKNGIGCFAFATFPLGWSSRLETWWELII